LESGDLTPSGGYHLDVRPCELDALLAAEYLQQDLDPRAGLHIGEDRQVIAKWAV
jgi:hypothetical protein